MRRKKKVVRQSPTEILRIKAAVRDRDGYRCTKCGMGNDEQIDLFGRQLDVHRKEPGSWYTVDGTVTLCSRCHNLEQKSPLGSRPVQRIKITREAKDKLARMAVLAPAPYTTVPAGMHYTAAQFLEDLIEAEYARFQVMMNRPSQRAVMPRGRPKKRGSNGSQETETHEPPNGEFPAH